MFPRGGEWGSLPPLTSVFLTGAGERRARPIRKKKEQNHVPSYRGREVLWAFGRDWR